jgi:hypothetical protein
MLITTMGAKIQAFDIFQTPLSSHYPLPLRKVIQKEILLWYLYVSSKYFYCVVPLILTYFLSQLFLKGTVLPVRSARGLCTIAKVLVKSSTVLVYVLNFFLFFS